VVFENNKRIILASASPRRRELLSLIITDFEIITVDVDERAAELRMEAEGVPAVRVSEGLAELKARAVYDRLSEESKKDSIVIGADTSVILDNVIYGKPKDRDDAIGMLSALSGNIHTVATGVALITGTGITVFTEETKVEFNPLDDYQRALISAYCDSGSPYDKAGGYGIQDQGALLVRRIEGDNANVIGLPVARLARELYLMIK